jgi:biotin transport system substrate-specific component
MQRDLTASISDSPAALARSSAASSVLLVAGASALFALSAQVAIPIPHSPIPITLQPLAILLVGAALGPARASAAACLYLLEGLAGLPVFALGHSGPAALIGPTAGYLYAYPAASWIAGWCATRRVASSRFCASLLMIAAIVTLYLGGWAWLAAAWGMGSRTAFIAGVAPFFMADLVKVALVVMLLPTVSQLVGRFTTTNQ